jgi:hypothetical protein
MNNDWKPTEINEGQPTNWEPRKQHPEEVADGLRDAFRQAIKDGVMDATPYLKQMTFNNDIEKTEAEIKVLQAKLELLKEIETHKSQPKMEFSFGGKFEVVSYNGMVYFRLEFPDEFYWYKKKYSDEGVLMVAITDGETCRLLEGVWFNDVKKGKYDEVEVAKPSKPLTLYQILCAEQGQFINREVICEIVEDWLPKEHDTNSDGWNKCVRMLRENLR